MHWYVLALALALAWFGRSGYAAPVAGERRGVDGDLLATFTLMGQYASAAYCSNNHDSVGDKVTCASGSCALVQEANTTTVAEFQKFPGTDITGYVARDDTNQLIVVAFRGSSSLQNWMTNLNMNQVRTDLCSGCTAHGGFWQAWIESRPGVLAAVKKIIASNPGYKIVATGHSLGGAVAALASAQLRNEGYGVALYSFGAPRIASSKLSDYISNQPGGNFRVTHWNDPVPRLPPLLMDYVHISPEYYIGRKNKESVRAADIKMYQGSINLRGNSAWLATDVAAHLWYFNSIAACGIDQFFRGG